MKQPRPKKKLSAKAKAKCPDELQSCKEEDADGNRFCWVLNLKGGCKGAVKDGKCPKEMHKCMKCLRSNHSVQNCSSGVTRCAPISRWGSIQQESEASASEFKHSRKRLSPAPERAQLLKEKLQMHRSQSSVVTSSDSGGRFTGKDVS